MSYIVMFRAGGLILSTVASDEAHKDALVDMLSHDGFHPLWAEGNYEVTQ